MKRRVRILSVIIILTATLAGGFLYLRYSSRPEREVTLKMDLRTMRQAIDQYTMDKQHPPQSLRDLVNGHYLRQIPTDPFTRKEDWVPVFGDSGIGPEQTVVGITDVHSATGQIGGEGAP